MNLISIVVPVYNGEKYLDKLFDCLSNQTYRNIEVLMVNDFSTDNSEKMISEMCKRDGRFVLVNATKKLGTAVKGQEYVLNQTKGDYYFFLSQDDFIDYDTLECMLNTSIEKNADVVLANMVLYYEGADSKKASEYPLEGDYDMELSGRDAYLLSMDWKIHGFSLRKMSLVKKIGIIAEYYNSCEYYLRLSYLHANKVCFADTNFYYRQDNNDAITKSLKYFHFDVVINQFKLYDCMVTNKYSRKECFKKLKIFTRSYCGWWYLWLRHKKLRVNDGYVIKHLFKMFPSVCLRWIKLPLV